MSSLRKIIQCNEVSDMNHCDELDLVMEQEELYNIESEIMANVRILNDVSEVQEYITESIENPASADIKLRKAAYLCGLDNILATEAISSNASSEEIELCVEGITDIINNTIQEALMIIAKILDKIKEYALKFFAFIRSIFNRRVKNIKKIQNKISEISNALESDEYKDKNVLELSTNYKSKLHQSLRNFIINCAKIKNGLKDYSNGLDQAFFILTKGEKNLLNLDTIFGGYIVPISKITLKDYYDLSKTKFVVKKMLLKDLRAYNFLGGFRPPKISDDAKWSGEAYAYVTFIEQGLHDNRLSLYKTAEVNSDFKKIIKDIEMSDFSCAIAGKMLSDSIRLFMTLDRQLYSLSRTQMDFLSYKQKIKGLITKDTKSYLAKAAETWIRLTKIFKSMSDFMYYFIMSTADVVMKDMNKPYFGSTADDSLQAIEYKG